MFRIITRRLKNKLTSNNYYTREEAVKKLGRSHNYKSIDLLIKALQDNNERVRWTACEALTNFKDIRITKALVNSLADNNERVQYYAASALLKLDYKFKDIYEQARINIIARKYDDAIALGSAAVPTLLNVIANCSFYIESSNLAEKALCKIKDISFVEPLLDALCDKNFHVRTAVAKTLGNIGSALSVEPLIFLLKNEKVANIFPNPKYSAIDALGKIGDNRAVEPLIEQLEQLKEEMYRELIISALTKLMDTRAIKPLVDIAKKDERLRYNAIKALKKIGGISEVIKLLISLLESSKPWMDYEIIKELGEVGEQSCIQILLKFTLNKRVADTAVSSLEKILDRSASFVSLEELKTIEKLNGIVYTHIEDCSVYIGATMDDERYSYEDKNVDCSRVNIIAKEEIIRRNLL